MAWRGKRHSERRSYVGDTRVARLDRRGRGGRVSGLRASALPRQHDRNGRECYRHSCEEDRHGSPPRPDAPSRVRAVRRVCRGSDSVERRDVALTARRLRVPPQEQSRAQPPAHLRGRTVPSTQRRHRSFGRPRPAHFLPVAGDRSRGTVLHLEWSCEPGTRLPCRLNFSGRQEPREPPAVSLREPLAHPATRARRRSPSCVRQPPRSRSPHTAVRLQRPRSQSSPEPPPRTTEQRSLVVTTWK
jgi:hypothetical protein